MAAVQDKQAISFGQAVAEVDERWREEAEAATRRWTIGDVERLERNLRQEGIDQQSTFYRDRAPMLVAMAKASHRRNNFRLPEEMSRSEFAQFLSVDVDPATGAETPAEKPLGLWDVFDRPEIMAISRRLVGLMDSRPSGKFRPDELHTPVMETMKTANQNNRIMGSGDSMGGEVMEQIREPRVRELLKQGRVVFRDETPVEREKRLDVFFEMAQAAVDLSNQLREFAAELAGAEQLGGGVGERALRSNRQALADALGQLATGAGELGPFAPWILEGDEVKRLTEQLARIDAMLAKSQRA